MKNILFLILLTFIVSCSKDKTLKSEMMNVEVVTKPINTTFTNHDLTKQKLQDYFDLLVLNQKKSKFNKEVLKQLQEFNYKSKTLVDSNTVSIENLKLLENPEIVNDSLEKMKVSFDLITRKNLKKDSIMVIIKTQKITIDGKIFFAKKVVFETLFNR